MEPGAFRPTTLSVGGVGALPALAAAWEGKGRQWRTHGGLFLPCLLLGVGDLPEAALRQSCCCFKFFLGGFEVPAEDVAVLDVCSRSAEELWRSVLVA